MNKINLNGSQTISKSRQTRPRLLVQGKYFFFSTMCKKCLSNYEVYLRSKRPEKWQEISGIDFPDEAQRLTHDPTYVHTVPLVPTPENHPVRHLLTTSLTSTFVSAFPAIFSTMLLMVSLLSTDLSLLSRLVTQNRLSFLQYSLHGENAIDLFP